MKGARDDFWTRQALELKRDEHIEAISAQMRELEAQRALATRISALQDQPGFKHFIEGVEGLREAAAFQTTALKTADDLFRLQGALKAYDCVLAIFKQAEIKEKQLATQLQNLQNEQRTVEELDPLRGVI